MAEKSRWVRARERDPDGFRKRKREAARRQRAADPEKYRARMKANKARYRNNLCPQKKCEQNRKWALKKLYGLSLEDYDKMLEKQNGGCAICRRPCRDGKPLVVDHDHDTGKVRALLCSTCNPGLGFFDTNPELLQAAIEYLMRFRTEGVV